MKAERKKAAPDGANIESSSGEQCVLADIRISGNDFNTEWTPTQGISALLLEGESNAITIERLEAFTGLESREIRRMIHKERLRGSPILANNRSGYFLPANDDEQVRCVSSMRHRAEEIKNAADAIERAGRREQRT